MNAKRLTLCAILVAVGIFVAGMIAAFREGNSPFGQARKANTIEAYEEFIKKNPGDSQIPEAEKRIRLMKYSFRPKFFLIFEDRDPTGEISVFNYDFTRNEEEAATLAYVNAPSSGEFKVAVRFVDKKTRRERTIVATSSDPAWVRVTVVNERVTSSGGGSHTIDGKTFPEAHNGQGYLLTDLLKYAQTLESEK